MELKAAMRPMRLHGVSEEQLRQLDDLYHPAADRGRPGPQTVLLAAIVAWSGPRSCGRTRRRCGAGWASAIRDVARLAIRCRAGSSGQRDTRSPFAGTGCPFVRSIPSSAAFASALGAA